MSATLKAFAIVLSISGSRVWQEPPAASIFSLAAALKACAWTVELLRDLAAGEDLDRIRALREALLLERRGVHLGAGVEALLEVAEVDRLRGGAEVLERHRLLYVRAAELSHPHVDRVLPALVAGLALGARARARSPCGRGPRSCPGRCPRRGRSACAAVREPGFGFRLCSPISSSAQASLSALSATVDLDQVRDDAELALQLRRVLPLDGLADPPEPERLQASLSGSGWSRSRTEPA